ncbi:MAG: hypothetical protein OK455_05505 [Thaumarchaeota archaeon]|nr:hypothetical protein [Nitrososphaerota archaeon]
MTKTARQEEANLPVKINRKAPAPSLLPLTDYFKGFEKVEAVRSVFGGETEEVLSRLRIAFISNKRMYMGIRDDDGNIAVGTYHLRHSDEHILYLDIVHELFHIKQWMNDKEWFTQEHLKFMRDRSLYYVSPIEVPAYKHTVREAERLGMHHEEITEYLRMLPVPPKVFAGFLKEMEIRRSAGPAPSSKVKRKVPVKINRDPELALHPFTEYFQGFEKAAAVRALYGKSTEEVLRGLEVEFVDGAFGSIYPSEEDGHLVVNLNYLKEAEISSIYLDVLLSLNFLKRHPKTGEGSLYPEDLAEDSLVLESYRAMVEEARRIGTPDPEILEHLQLPKFMMSTQAYRKFVSALGLSKPGQKKRKALRKK